MCGGVRAGEYEMVPVIFAAAPTLPVPFDVARLTAGGFSKIVHAKPEWDHMAPVDRCIAEEVRALNESGIRTLGACCGGHEQIPLVLAEAVGRGGILIHAGDGKKVIAAGYAITVYPDRACCRYAGRVHAFYPPHVEVAPLR